ncbi:MAG: SulP family inorganic anion transporter [Planctomycetes bacterium]|nr:SulP family inorganic anion transporter [Planctomycetota bacterium]MBI3835585.1 SulP family inorganic anion transporter [Planctomycetota bacterium]
MATNGSDASPVAIPKFRFLRSYQWQWFRSDLVAGISVCVIMIPSVIAYAELAELPPAHGLYAALAGMVGYAFFASSPQVVAGPDAALTLLVAGAIGPLAGGDASKAAALAAVTALMGGLLMLLAARLRAGVIADFLSKPVLVGYLTGAALILVSTQLGKLFGIRSTEHDFFPVIAEIVRRIRETHRVTLGLGVGLIATLAVLRRFAPRIPGALVVSVVAILLSVSLDLAGHGVRVLGEMPRGLPSFAFPIVSLREIRELIPAAAGIVMLTFPEGILLARAFAAKNGYEVRANQELIALAASNISAGLFHGFSVGASQSRTVVADSVGGKSQVVSLVAAAALALFLLFLTPLLRQLPTVALAAILVFAGWHLIELREYRTLLKLTPLGFGLAIVVALGVLIIGVVPGIVLGVMISLVYLLARLARPPDAVLREIPGTGSFHDLGDAAEAQTVPGLIAYRFYSPLFFANTEHFVLRVRELIKGSPTTVKWFLLDLQAVWEIDITAAEALSRLTDELRQRNIVLCVTRANRPLREKFERIGLAAQLGAANFYPSVHAAIAEFRRQSAEGENNHE